MFDQHKNFAYSVITTAPTPASTGGSLGVVAGQGTLFPAVPFNAVAWPPNVNPTIFNAEVVRVMDITVDTFTIVRHQEGTSAQNIAVGWQIMAAITSKTLTDIENLLSGVTSGAILNAPSILTPGMTTPVITGGGSWAGNPSFSGAPFISSLANSQHDHHNAANGGQLNGATAILADTITAGQMANRTRRHQLLIWADNANGANITQNEGSPEISFTGTPTGFGRASGIVPLDLAGSTDVAIKFMLRASNSNNQGFTYFVGVHGDGQAFTSWNIQSSQNTPGGYNLTANVNKEFLVYTILAANIAPGNQISLAFRPNGAITGTVFVAAIFLDYTADM